MRGVVVFVCASFVFLTLGRAAAGRAEPQDPLTGFTVVPPTYVTIDDQLFDVTGLPETSQVPRSRPRGATVDSNNIDFSLKYNGWEAGIIPVEFAPDVSQAHRDQFMSVCNSGWSGAALVTCIPRTSQMGFLRVTEAVQESANAAPCFSIVGQPRRLVGYELHLGPTCWADGTVYHEQGHAFGFIHEHQRPDRDAYVFIDLSNVPANLQGNFAKLGAGSDPPITDALGPYDFLSIMHYGSTAYAANPGQPVIIPQPGYGSFANTMGTSSAPTPNDRQAIGHLYDNYMFGRALPPVNVTPTTRFDRGDFLDAMERLHALYFSRMGLARSNGLSIGGKPDFLGIATWIFDVYLGARSVGLPPDVSFACVLIDVTQSDEWKGKHPTWTSGHRGTFTPTVHLDRAEFLDVLNRLDAFYSAPEGLQRPNGLSIAGGPDFLGIAAWVFDVYLNERLSGGSATVAWTRVVNAIQSTPEWQSKH